MKILFATTNKHKLNEVKKILKKHEVISLSDLNDTDVVIEDGESFKENAAIKARYYYLKYHIPTIADDSGLCIEYLNNYPGIYSARFLSTDDYKIKNRFIVDLLKDVDNRKAFFHCSICFINDGIETFFEGNFLGSISNEYDDSISFGYDPIFIPKDHDMTVAKLGEEFKNQNSHRANALFKLGVYLEKNT